MPAQKLSPLVGDVDRLDSAQLSVMLNGSELLKAKSLGQVTFGRVGYLRLSKDRGKGKAGGGADGLGVQRQHFDICDEWPEDPVEFWYVDNDTSAWSGVDRPDYFNMRADMESGVIRSDATIRVAHSDRLHRDTAEAIEFMVLCFDYKHHTHQRDIVVDTVMSGRMNFHTADGRKQFRDGASNATWYSDVISEKVGKKFDQKVRRGEPLSGKRTMGFQVGGIEHVPAEAEAIREGARMILAGQTLLAVANKWTADGIVTVDRQRRIYPTVVKQALTRHKTVGKGVRRGVEYQGCWEPILDEETWKAVRAILLDPSRKPVNWSGSKVRWLGTRLYRCGSCGDTMFSTNGRYRCSAKRLDRFPDGKIHVSRPALAVDEVVVAILLAALADENIAADIAERNSPGSVGGLRERRAEIEAQIEEYRSLVGQPGWGPAQIGAAVSTLTVELNAIDSNLSATAIGSPAAEFIAGGVSEARWEELTLHQRRALLNETMTVTIRPARNGNVGIGADSLDLQWHTGRRSAA